MFESLSELRVIGSKVPKLNPKMLESIEQAISDGVENEMMIPMTCLMRGSEEATFIMILAIHRKIPEC
jgi:hypothetical protein